jgi:Caspase domain
MKQCALIIGNDAYPDAVLKNAVNDATDIEAKLKELGFTCILTANATHKEMDQSLSDFGSQLSAHEVGLFFFAGHGMQIDGVNYLAAVDTSFDKEIDAKYSSLQLNKVIETMEIAGNRTSVIILDACRNNPYERRWRSGGPRGLAPVYAPKGMIIGYATSPGQVASDGDGKNGAYTHALLSHIGQQDLSVESFFKRVRNSLSSSTSGKQISWEHTSLMGDYYFNNSLALTGSTTAYSEDAIADGMYRPRGPIGDIIQGLKSHNFYEQNPAINQISPVKLEAAGKDECFVLGRNIYQAACGGSFSAEPFVSALSRSLHAFPEPIRLHLLNGMLYELYFDSRGLKRKFSKANKLDEVFALEDNPEFTSSFEFIKKALQPFLAELFYIPGSKTEVCVDLVVAKFNAIQAIAKVCFEGQNVLYGMIGEGYFDLNIDGVGEIVTRQTIRAKLSEALATPQFRLKISYVGEPLAEDKFGAPYRLNLQRIAPK